IESFNSRFDTAKQLQSAQQKVAQLEAQVKQLTKANNQLADMNNQLQETNNQLQEESKMINTSKADVLIAQDNQPVIDVNDLQGMIQKMVD
ncbi:MAG: hypothetical protein ACYT04_000000101650, partial [Nostoc sp.]